MTVPLQCRGCGNHQALDTGQCRSGPAPCLSHRVDLGFTMFHYECPVENWTFSGPHYVCRLRFGHIPQPVASSIHRIVINPMINNQKASNLGVANVQKTPSNTVNLLYMCLFASMCPAHGIFDLVFAAVTSFWEHHHIA